LGNTNNYGIPPPKNCKNIFQPVFCYCNFSAIVLYLKNTIILKKKPTIQSNTALFISTTMNDGLSVQIVLNDLELAEGGDGGHFGSVVNGLANGV
jgi:hypothetical protein